MHEMDIKVYIVSKSVGGWGAKSSFSKVWPPGSNASATSCIIIILALQFSSDAKDSII